MSIGRLSLGTAHFGMPYGVASPGAALSERQVTGVLQAAVDLGISCLDTSPDYGVAEQRIGAFLYEHDLADEIAICTKLPALGPVASTRVAHLVEERLTGSLRRLRTEAVDGYVIDDIEDLRLHGQALVDALGEQGLRGRVLDIGVSVYEPAELELLESYPELNVVQHPCNLLDRRLLDDDWPDRLSKRGCKLQLRSVLLQGLLAMPADSIPKPLAHAREAVANLQTVLAAHGWSAPTAAIAFACDIDADRVIIAANSSAQVEQLAAAAERVLPAELLAELQAKLGTLPNEVIDPRRWPAPS
jgi:aryl-alcohol dehydrogenase-like predicted oxidoreductase